MVQPFYRDSGDNLNLNFDSIFESGNLALAVKVTETEYDLIL